MISCVFLVLYFIVVDAAHFNGGMISWVPVSPYDNTSSVIITIIQSYWWSYPTIKCANNVPITTSGRSSQGSNLTCVADCSTDGHYSSSPVQTLTDCVSASSSLGMMISERSVNITLTNDTHFYLAYVGSAWRPLGSPAKAGLEWSISTFIDLRKRSDGFINTPPIASIVSPQYVIVNRTTQIKIPVSDANVGDDVRCRWAIYTSGYRRRRAIDEDHYHKSTTINNIKSSSDNETILIRKKRLTCSTRCLRRKCDRGCPCNCTMCIGTTCTGSVCTNSPYCATGTTTIDIPATLRPTSTYPIRQAIDECGDICYPNSMPDNTTLSNCVLSFKGLVPDTWYAAAIQVEDFIDQASNTPMSSVPIQFLIYVMPEPLCSELPIILPLTMCLEVKVSMPISFDLFALNLCDPNITDMADIILSKEINGISKTNMTISSTNTSLASITITWTPQANQIGAQEMCATAYTDEQVQSVIYCVTFNVTTAAGVCVTTTTTTTTTTSTISTSSSTSVTSATTTTSTSISTISSSTMDGVTTNEQGKGPSWGLIAGILSVSLPLALCTCCCLYQLLWSPAAKRRRQAREMEEQWQYDRLSSRTETSIQTSSNTNENVRIRKPSRSYHVYNILSKTNSVTSPTSTMESEPSILVSIYNNTNAKRLNNIKPPHNVEQSFEMGNAWIKPQTHHVILHDPFSEQSFASKSCPTLKTTDLKEANQSFNINRQMSDHVGAKPCPKSPFQIDDDNDLQSPRNNMSRTEGTHNTTYSVFDFEDLAGKYTLGHNHKKRTSHA